MNGIIKKFLLKVISLEKKEKKIFNYIFYLFSLITFWNYKNNKIIKKNIFEKLDKEIFKRHI